MSTDSTLPKHTIFAPKTPPAGNVSLPFIAWGNGGCSQAAGEYERMLVEIASYGYVIAADGTPTGAGTSGQSKVQDMRDSLDWAFAGKAKKYGNVDLTKVTTAGHSCGGLESYSTAYHDERVKRIVLFNIAIFQDDRRYLLQEIKVPVAYFVGGSKDMGYVPVSSPSTAMQERRLIWYRAARTTIYSTSLSFVRASILDTGALGRLSTEANKERRRLPTWSGNGETTPRQKSIS
jgi:pimeloyl-ACP methyl ester carboxylesterase